MSMQAPCEDLGRQLLAPGLIGHHHREAFGPIRETTTAFQRVAGAQPRFADRCRRHPELLGLVRAGGEPHRLRATGAEAIRWWEGNR